MIPLHVKTRDFTDPGCSLYYLVAANGIFLVQRTQLFTSITETRVVPALVGQAESLKLSFPKVPRKVMEAIYGFFREVYRRWDGEAIVLLFYSPATGAFRLGVPPQTLFRFRHFGDWRTEGRVEYGHFPRPDGFLKLGDAHSHGDLPAFFSHTDDRDDKEDGLRITIGGLHRYHPDVRVSFVAGGIRFMLKPEDVMEEFSTPLAPPQEWLKKVTCRYEGEGVEGEPSQNERQQLRFGTDRCQD